MYGTAFRLYFSLMYGSGMHEETVFLNITQALEYLHPQIFRDRSRYCSTEQWRKFLQWFRENFPQDIAPHSGVAQRFANRDNFVGLLVSRVGSLNNFSLQSKLEDLLEGVPENTLYPICDNPRDIAVYRAQLIKKTVRTRNYLTHFNEEEKRRAASGEELRKMCGQLWAVLTYWLGKEFISDEKILDNISIESSEKAQFVIRFKAKV